MGHLVGKDIFRELGRKIDGMEMRAPWNEKLHALLKELYSPEEADVVITMPYGLSTFEHLVPVTGYEQNALRRILDSLTEKGLVMDLWVHDAYHYTPSPLVIGIFEFTMMRMGPNTNSREWAKLLHDYLDGDDAFRAANFGNGEQVSFLRALPYEETVKADEYVEILDYERASALIEESETFAIGLCSCRHEKMHLGEKPCDTPLEMCSQFGYAADFMIRNNLARKVDRSEMRDTFTRSRELGLVMAADNVRKNMKFVCHCCACCCTILQAVNTYGYTNCLVTSNYLAGIDDDACVGCGMCVTACPITAISLVGEVQPGQKSKKVPRIDTATCLGCGVCALRCPTRTCRLTKREQRVIHPETTFERIMLQCLEKGTLHNQIFANPQSVNEKFMRSFVGGFLKLPAVKRALMSDKLRSRFLSAMREGVIRQGKGWVTEL
jgi:ferredoxin